MHKTVNLLKQLIVNETERFILDNDLTEHDIDVIDNYADCLISRFEQMEETILKSCSH